MVTMSARRILFLLLLLSTVESKTRRNLPWSSGVMELGAYHAAIQARTWVKDSRSSPILCTFAVPLSSLTDMNCHVPCHRWDYEGAINSTHTVRSLTLASDVVLRSLESSQSMRMPLPSEVIRILPMEISLCKIFAFLAASEWPDKDISENFDK
jgi:hypothetical protein